MQKKLALLLGFASLLAFSSAAYAGDYVLTQLGSGGPAMWGLLAGPVATDIHMNGPGVSSGNAGISAGTLSLSQSVNPGINGNVYLATGATVSNPSLVSGTIFTGQDAIVNSAVTAAINAGNTFSGLAPTITNITSFTGPMTIFANPNADGVTVIDLTGGINLSGASAVVTLVGSSTDDFVINVSSTFHMQDAAMIVLSGGLIQAHVVFNVEPGVTAIQTSGGLNQEPVLNGILLANGAKLQFATMSVVGEIFTNAKGDQFASGSTYTQAPPPGGPPVPEPVTFLLIGPALGALVLWRRTKNAKTARS